MSLQNLSGHTIGGYELSDLLGSGGMGTVYRAYQINLKRHVAIKVLSRSLASEPGHSERFSREAEIIAALEHPHIVPIHDYGTQQGVSYVVMRLLTGGSLQDRLDHRLGQERLLPSLREVNELVAQLANALEYAHNQGVIHRDIKPSNVMFDNHGHAFLVDFGIAKILTDANALTTSGVMMGTPMFMSPEQWRSEEVTPAADQYTLGGMVYLMIGGKFPFEAPTPYRMMHKHLNETPVPLRQLREEVPEVLNEVIERAMAKDPADRFPSITNFAEAFESAIRDVETASTNLMTFRLPTRPIDEISPDTPKTFLRDSGRLSLPKLRSVPAVAGIIVVLAVVVAGVFLALGVGGGDGESNPAGGVGSNDLTNTSATSTATRSPVFALAELGVSSNGEWQPYSEVFNGAEMMLVPAGAFTMGSENAQIDMAFDMCNESARECSCARASYEDESPTNAQEFTRPFWIDKTEVTYGQYRECWGARVCSPITGVENLQDEDPVYRVTWEQAQTYCEWRVARLPTEAEWEYAARGPDGLVYPWGNEFTGSEANHCDGDCFEAGLQFHACYDNRENDDSFAGVAPVGSYPQSASWVGALDMSGNVWEWTSSISTKFPYDAGDGRENMTDVSRPRIFRGGAFDFPSADLRGAGRAAASTDSTEFIFGFRCARSY